MRHLHKSWQDRRPGWTRRIRWYEGSRDVRLKMEDETGVTNRQFTNHDIAQEAYDAFVAGDLTVTSARKG